MGGSRGVCTRWSRDRRFHSEGYLFKSADISIFLLFAYPRVTRTGAAVVELLPALVFTLKIDSHRLSVDFSHIILFSPSYSSAPAMLAREGEMTATSLLVLELGNADLNSLCKHSDRRIYNGLFLVVVYIPNVFRGTPEQLLEVLGIALSA